MGLCTPPHPARVPENAPSPVAPSPPPVGARSVPPGLCGRNERFSMLRDLILSNNIFTGSLEVPDCDSLIYLDGQVRSRGGWRST
jgi:hypothetical protein